MKFSKTYKLEEIANIIGAEIIGDKNFPVTGINEIHMVENAILLLLTTLNIIIKH